MLLTQIILLRKQGGGVFVHVDQFYCGWNNPCCDHL